MTNDTSEFELQTTGKSNTSTGFLVTDMKHYRKQKFTHTDAHTERGARKSDILRDTHTSKNTEHQKDTHI